MLDVMKYKKSTKSIWILCAAAAAVLMGAGGTGAYLTSFDTAANPVSVGQNTTEIEEEFPDPTPVPVEENPEYPKEVRVSNQAADKNEFQSDCYVRMAVGFSHSDIGDAVVLKDLDTENWVYGEDGFYYFRNLLKPGETTTPLFTGFMIDSAGVDRDYLELIPEFEIQIYEESVQAEGFTDYAEAWDSYRHSS